MGSIERNESTARLGTHVCDVCGATFESKAALDQHVREEGLLY